MTDDPTALARAALLWKRRSDSLQARHFAAHQRERAAASRAVGAQVRASAADIRAGAAMVRDDAARTRDDAARVRDSAALVRDRAARARDAANKTREDALRRRINLATSMEVGLWAQLLELDRVSSEQSREATTHDRDAAILDRAAADKDRTAAERDRSAADSDRLAADKDREAAEQESLAADADRAAADSDRDESERTLEIAEQRLSKSDRLATMGRFVAVIAHEINNPLTILMTTLGAAHVALGNDHAAPDVAPLVNDALLATRRIADIVKDVRSWLEDGEDGAAATLIDVEKLVRQSVALTAGALQQRAKIVIDVQPTPPLWGVSSRLGQLVTNLVANAADSINGPQDDNEIRITVKAVEHGGEPFVAIEVKDTGAGIAADVVPHIFDPFFTTREPSGGMGLGLAMCQQIVTMHGGAITVASIVGKGTTMTALLPSGSGQPSAAAASTRAPPAAARVRVLVIDDDAMVARAIARSLAVRCDVTLAANGREGLAHITNADPPWDLILCDLMMPVMNGRELYLAVLARAPEVAADIVFISGGATTAETADFMRTLSNVQLAKPFSAAQLLDFIDARAERRRH